MPLYKNYSPIQRARNSSGFLVLKVLLEIEPLKKIIFMENQEKFPLFSSNIVQQSICLSKIPISCRCTICSAPTGVDAYFLSDLQHYYLLQSAAMCSVLQHMVLSDTL